METGKIEEYLEMASDAVIAYAPKVIVALLILLIGIRVINKVVSVSVRSMTERRHRCRPHPFPGVGCGNWTQADAGLRSSYYPWF